MSAPPQRQGGYCGHGMLPACDYTMPEARLPLELGDQLCTREITEGDLGFDREYLSACLDEVIVERGGNPGCKERVVVRGLVQWRYYRKTTWQDRMEALRMAEADA